MSNPARPTRVGRYLAEPALSARFVWTATVSGDYAYVATPEGLEVVDIKNPLNPQRVGATEGGTGDVSVVAANHVDPAAIGPTR